MEISANLLELQINLTESCRLGQFANAFRVVELEGLDCFLDFLVYSVSEGTASVVSRVKVRRAFLPVLREQLDKTLMELGSSDVHDCWLSRN